MINALLVFLIGSLALSVVFYVFSLVLPQLKLPEQVNQIVRIIVGLIGLVVLIMLTIDAFNGAPGAIVIFR